MFFEELSLLSGAGLLYEGARIWCCITIGKFCTVADTSLKMSSFAITPIDRRLRFVVNGRFAPSYVLVDDVQNIREFGGFYGLPF